MARGWKQLQIATAGQWLGIALSVCYAVVRQ